MSIPFASDIAAWPHRVDGLEEVCARTPRDMAAALIFSLLRLPSEDRRPVALAATKAWSSEQGRPHGPGFSAGGLGSRRPGLLLITGRTQTEILWAMEQGLRSGALSAVLGTIEGATLAQTRRLEFAARDGAAAGILLRAEAGGLSAARRRWQITTRASANHADDPRSPGRVCLEAELIRSRTERPGIWMLEQDDETHRLRLADRLAGDGLVERPTGLAA